MEYERRFQERKLIKNETKLTIILSLAMLGSVTMLGLAAYFINPDPVMPYKELEEIWGIINIVVIMIMVMILAGRRTIYYSKRFIQEDYTLTQVLVKWRQLDIILLAIAETIPITGLVIDMMGMPFKQTFHFFVAGAILMILIMPVGIKVRSKLGILRQSFPDIPLE